MITNVKTKSGKLLPIDFSQWNMAEDYTCNILEEIDGDFVLESKNKLTARISKHVIIDNHIRIRKDIVNIGGGLFNYYFKDKFLSCDKYKMNNIFNDNKELIFQNRDLVLSKAEYYIMRPDILSSGSMYLGGFYYSLGSLFESIESGKHIYFDEIAGHEKLYLVSMVNSPLSGTIYKALFWSEQEKKMVRLEEKLSGVEIRFIREFKKMVEFSNIPIDYQSKAIQQLVNEINERRSLL